MTRDDTGMRFSEIPRRLHNIVRWAEIAEVDADAGRARADYGVADEAVLTSWLPWIAHRAGADKSWWAPEVGERCLILAPGGELAAAALLVGMYADDRPAPSSSPDKHITRYADGAIVTYDRAAHALSAVLPAGGTAAIDAPDGVTITGDVKITGDLTVTGNAAIKGDCDVDGPIDSKTSVSDPLGSMGEMRGTYNSHTHIVQFVAGGFTAQPVLPAQRMT